jgi:inosine-uridine nucleoside N-ribohydrolase
MMHWLDVDTGIDDAVALLAAAGLLPASALGFVSAVAGNVALPHVVENTRRVLAAAGRGDVDVYAGADRPLVRPMVDAAYVHGESGLGAVTLPVATRPVAGGLLDLLERLRTLDDRSLCLVATGPLTNVALLCRLAPDVLRRTVARTVWMGGGRGIGNITVAAEFNAFADPEAAAIALDVLAPVTVVDLNTTHRAYLTPEEVAALGRLPGALGPLAQRVLEDPVYGGPHPGHEDHHVVVHDAVALLEAVRPGSMFALRRERVAVDLSGGPSYGATLVGRKANGPEADWPEAPDRARFAALLAEALSSGR